MLRIGLTGGIGSGKSTVAKIFDTLGVPVFYSDIEAARLLYGDNQTRKAILDEFGKSIISAKKIDRKKLAEIVFNDPEKLNKLNSIIHPSVRQRFKEWIKQKRNFPYIIQEAAILMETGNYKNLDFNILVISPEQLRINRVMQRDHISAEDVKARMENQWTDKKKKELADAVIINDEKKLVLPQVLKIHKRLLSRHP